MNGFLEALTIINLEIQNLEQGDDYFSKVKISVLEKIRSKIEDEFDKNLDAMYNEMKGE